MCGRIEEEATTPAEVPAWEVALMEEHDATELPHYTDPQVGDVIQFKEVGQGLNAELRNVFGEVVEVYDPNSFGVHTPGVTGGFGGGVGTRERPWYTSIGSHAPGGILLVSRAIETKTNNSKGDADMTDTSITDDLRAENADLTAKVETLTALRDGAERDRDYFRDNLRTLRATFDAYKQSVAEKLLEYAESNGDQEGIEELLTDLGLEEFIPSKADVVVTIRIPNDEWTNYADGVKPEDATDDDAATVIRKLSRSELYYAIESTESEDPA